MLFLPKLHALVPILLLAVMVAAIFALKLALAGQGGPKFRFENPLLSAPEQKLYRLLVAALPDHIVLAQVAFSQLLKVEGGTHKDNFAKYGTARQKVADYVICDKSFSVVAVVELDDSTHTREKDEKRDAIIKEAGGETVRWRVGKLPTGGEIRRQVLGT